MTKQLIKIISIFSILLVLFSCRAKLDQNSMFKGRAHKNKKGVYSTGLNGRKTVSMQIAKELDKQTPHDTNPKKAARKVIKANKKKMLKAQKKRDKINKKRKVKIKKVKGKSAGDS